MKRRLALVLSLILLFTMVLPLGAYAEGLDKGLENAIKIVKDKFSIPDGYKFDSSIDASSYNNETIKVFRLSWVSEDVESFNASVDEKGTILNYSHYKYSDGAQQTKLPKYSLSEAKSLADKFLVKVIPDMAGKLQYQPSTYTGSLYDTYYYLNYIRVENGVPFFNNNAVVNVNRNTGEIENYYLNWSYSLNFPDPAKAITTAKAQEAYTNYLGLRLIYKYSYTDGKILPYPVYVPKYNSNYAIDAITGKKIEIGSIGMYPYYDTGATTAQKSAAENAAGVSVALSQEEMQAVEKAGKIISIENAEKIARSLKYLDLKGYKLEYWSLNKNWPANDSFSWYMSFNKPATKTAEASYASVAVDSLTGKVKSFSTNWNYADSSKTKVSYTDAKKAADKFLKEFKPEYYSQVAFDEIYNIDYSKQEKPSYINFNYTRKVNGVFFPDNMISIGYDAVNGKVVSFDINWFNATFPSIASAIKPDAAYKSLFGKIGLELQYTLVTANATAASTSSKILPVPADQAKTKVALVYSLNPNKPAYISANDGSLLDYDGKPFVENSTVNYTDISGNKAENEIKVLAEYGITTGGTQFKPDEAITQKDFFILLSKALGYNVSELKSDASDEIINNMYKYLVRNGIVKETEKSKDAKVTREEAVKFIIRALKYDKLAGYSDMFNCKFTDKYAISSELTGYITIAGNLGLIDYGYFEFKPKTEMTRAETAVLIYRYLKL